MNEDIQQKISENVYNDIWDMSLEELRDFHMCYCQNTYYSMQEVTEQDISKEFIEKHRLLSKNIKKQND